MSKTTWTAEDWRRKRAEQRANKTEYDGDDPFYHPRFVAAGRELARLEMENSMTPCPPKCTCIDCRRPKRVFIVDDTSAIALRMREIDREKEDAKASGAQSDVTI